MKLHTLTRPGRAADIPLKSCSWMWPASGRALTAALKQGCRQLLQLLSPHPGLPEAPQSSTPDPPAHCDRMLLLEDCDTGDVLTLLVSGLPLFGENYSRKLANKAFLALAATPATWQPSGSPTGPRAWRAAFEAPPAVKALVRLHDPQAPKVCAAA